MAKLKSHIVGYEVKTKSFATPEMPNLKVGFVAKDGFTFVVENMQKALDILNWKAYPCEQNQIQGLA
jgi:hypothetical protein